MNNLYKVCFLGFGKYARENYFPHINSLNNCSIVGLSLDLELKRTKSKSYEGIPFFSSQEKMISASEPNIAVISTPNALHYEHVKFCLNHNLHILVDKPLACGIQNATELIQLSKQQNKYLFVSFERRYEQLYITAKELIQKGVIGKIKEIRVNYARTVNPFFYESWRNSPELSGGGVFLDTGSHIVDIIIWICNLKITKINSVFLKKTNMAVENYFSVKFEFEQQGIGEFNFEYHQDNLMPKIEQIYFLGTTGSILLESKNTVDGKSKKMTHTNINGVKSQYDYTDNANTGKPFSNLIASIEQKKYIMFEPESVLPGIEFIEKAYSLSTYSEK